MPGECSRSSNARLDDSLSPPFHVNIRMTSPDRESPGVDVRPRGVSASAPIVAEMDGLVSLSFDDEDVQSCMLATAPDALALGYTRTMMGFALLHAEPSDIGMIGLGGGSLVKYCYRHLPDARLTVAEINPDVIALRDRFHVPPDDDRLTVLCMDGACFVSDPAYRFDVLLVDGFDAGGLPAALGSRAFYRHCRDRLREHGVFAANLLTDDPRLGDYLAGFRAAFGASVAIAPAEDSANNIIVFAWNSDAAQPSLETLVERAAQIAGRHSVDLVEAAARIELGARYDWKRFGLPATT